MNNEYQQTSPLPNQVVHTVVEHSSKLLADTILEMGVIVHDNKQVINNLTFELENTQYKLGTTQHELSKTNVRLMETTMQLTDADKQAVESKKHLEDIRSKIKAIHDSYEHYMAKAKAELIARDVIIDQLLETYDISRTDKRKIKKLRVEGTPPK